MSASPLSFDQLEPAQDAVDNKLGWLEFHPSAVCGVRFVLGSDQYRVLECFEIAREQGQLGVKSAIWAGVVMKDMFHQLDCNFSLSI